MKKNLFFIIFFPFLTLFCSLILSNSIFHLTESQKNWFDGLEREWIEPFKKLAHLSDKEVKMVKDIIADVKKQRFEWLFLPEKNQYYHDKNIPRDLMQRLYNVLQKYGINIYRIDIRTEKPEENCIAAVGDSPHYLVKRDDQIIALRYETNPILWVYEALYSLDDDTFESVLLHECGHLVEAHSGQRILLQEILKDKKVDNESVEAFFKRFTCIIELIADQRLTIASGDYVLKMLSKYGTRKYTKEMLLNSVASIPRDRLKINYDAGYPSYAVRSIALMAMTSNVLYKSAIKDYTVRCG